MIKQLCECCNKKMNTGELVAWLNEVAKYYAEYEEPERRIRQIIRRLKKCEELEDTNEKILTYLKEVSRNLKREGIEWCHLRIEEYIKELKIEQKE